MDVIKAWRDRCSAERQKVIALEQQVAELQRPLNALPATPTPQTDNITTIEEEYTDNSESVVNVGSMDNVGNKENISNNTDNNVINYETADAITLINHIMDKYKMEKRN